LLRVHDLVAAAAHPIYIVLAAAARLQMPPLRTVTLGQVVIVVGWRPRAPFSNGKELATALGIPCKIPCRALFLEGLGLGNQEPSCRGVGNPQGVQEGPPASGRGEHRSVGTLLAGVSRNRRFGGSAGYCHPCRDRQACSVADRGTDR
jgi:hypothetical protein